METRRANSKHKTGGQRNSFCGARTTALATTTATRGPTIANGLDYLDD